MPATGSVEHRQFRDLPDLLRRGDLLVVNDSRVMPARIKVPAGEAQAEILLLNPAAATTDGAVDIWECLTRPARRFRVGTELPLHETLRARVLAVAGDGLRTLGFDPPGRLLQLLPVIGEVPLPPYIHERLQDPARYQTIFSAPAEPERCRGSAAAPTAGLHFSAPMVRRLSAGGFGLARLTLRVGLGTFQPLREDDLGRARLHAEWYSIPQATRDRLTLARRQGTRVVAVGTTVVRALETAALTGRDEGLTELFIRPGHRFGSVDALVTNFHLPRSSLLVLVSAFAGRQRVLSAYREAIAQRYGFYSFGDAMLIEPGPGTS